jgi:UDP-glucose 4-epimerase
VGLRVLVTGGAGFIGSHLVDALMKSGYEVRVVDNLSQGRIENISRWMGRPGFEFIKGDVTDEDLMRGGGQVLRRRLPSRGES